MSSRDITLRTRKEYSFFSLIKIVYVFLKQLIFFSYTILYIHTFFFFFVWQQMTCSTSTDDNNYFPQHGNPFVSDFGSLYFSFLYKKELYSTKSLYNYSVY